MGNNHVRTALLVACLLLPNLGNGAFSLLGLLLPLPVFFFSTILGRKKALLLLRNSGLVAAGFGLLLGVANGVVISFCTALAGLFLGGQGTPPQNPLRAGGRCLLAMLTFFLVILAVIAVDHGGMRGLFLAGMDEVLTANITVWEQSGRLSPDELLQLKSNIALLRQIMPVIMPGMLMVSLLMTVWINMLLANRLLRLVTGNAPWPPFRQWRLVDRLVWLLIAGGLGLLVSPLAPVALNVVLVMATLYMLQGLAVLVHLLDRWSVPPFLRIFIYIMLVLQSLGLALIVLGLIDVWADFRRPRGGGASGLDEA